MTIELTEVSKKYGKKTVLRDLSFTCAPGTITGFLGQNGAGKSTGLRILTGLTAASSGSAKINGQAYREISNPACVVGVALDASSLTSGRTGSNLMRSVARLVGASASRADALLEHVGLAESANKKIRSYSLGMRQRLGLAVALIGDPPTLVLDEPINGLDPGGVTWLRTLLRKYARDGGTVLLSSHVLNEVAATVDRVVVLADGRVVAEGSVDELSSSGATFINCLNPADLSSALTRLGINFSRQEEMFTINAPREELAPLIAEMRIAVLEMRSQQSSLEDTYFRLTGPSVPTRTVTSGANSLRRTL